jgi:hypothetical protein
VPLTNAEKAKRRMDRYWSRKERGLCPQCEATLQEDDGNLCVECDEASRRSKLRHVHSEHGKRKSVEATNRRRARLRAQGACIVCMGSLEGSTSKSMCVEHVAQRRAYQQKSRRRKKFGITPIRASKRTLRAEPIADEIRTYQPHDKLRSAPRVRILMALSWHEWIAARELFTLLSVDFSDQGQSREYDAYTQMLCRLVRHGFVARRGRATSAQYQITALGREEVARYRSGDFRRRERKAA